MWTKRALIFEAFSELGLQGYEFDISPEEQQTALRRLDSMVASWEQDGIRLGYAFPVSPLDSDLDDESGLSEATVETVYLQLAMRLGPGFGKGLNALTRKIATDGYARLLRCASVIPRMARPRVLAGAGNKGRGYGLVFLPPLDTVIPCDSDQCLPPECEVEVQATRSGDFTLVTTDSNTVIPVIGDCAVTVNASSDLTGPLRIVRYDAGNLSILQVGVSVINPATGAPWATLEVTNHLSSVLIEPGGAADEYVGLRIGA